MQEATSSYLPLVVMASNLLAMWLLGVFALACFCWVRWVSFLMFSQVFVGQAAAARCGVAGVPEHQ